MRILQLAYEYPPVGGGTGRIVAGLSRELVRQGHEVDVVTMAFRTEPAEETIDGVRIRRIPCLRFRKHYCSVGEAATFAGAHAIWLRRLLAGREYDINHTHSILPDGWGARRIRRKTGLPFVVTAHGSDVPGYNPDRLALAHRLLAPIWESVVAAADRIVTPSLHLEKLVRLAAPQARSTVIPNGIEMPPACATGERQGVLVVSRLLRRKGVQHLIEALAASGCRQRLHVVGDGPYLPVLRSMATEKKLSVQFHGWLENPSSRLEELYRRCAIFALPSARENFPVALLEAMSHGLAIITSRGTGCAEVVGDSGLLVEAGNVAEIRAALEALVEDQERVRELGAQAQRRVATAFSWSVVAGRYLQVYEQFRRREER